MRPPWSVKRVALALGVQRTMPPTEQALASSVALASLLLCLGSAHTDDRLVLKVPCRRTAGKLLWLDSWHSVLAPELRGPPDKPPTQVSIHLRQASPPRNIRCESAAQAAQVLQAVHRCLAALPRARLLEGSAGGAGLEDSQTPAAAVRRQSCPVNAQHASPDCRPAAQSGPSDR